MSQSQVQVSAKHRMLVVPNDPAILNVLPASRAVSMSGGGSSLLIPHGVSETFILRKLGYQVPSPILTHYQWPGAAKPFDVQKKTCALLTMNPAAYVLNSMGTGKTRAALWSWDYLRSNNLCGKMLVVAPLSTLSFVWLREVIATLSHRKCVVLHGTKVQRLEKLNDPDAEIFIINHDGVKVIEGELLRYPDIDTLVVDELAVYRNAKAVRTKCVQNIARQMKWVWGMTGSPMPNSPTDVWAQCKIVTPTTVPKFFGRFRDELMVRPPHSQFKWVPKENAVDKAFAAMQPAVRFTLDDVLELPDVVERTIDVELCDKQKRVYNDMRLKCYSMVQAKEITAVNAGVALNKLLQVSLGWVYTADKSVVELGSGSRVSALIDAILSADRKVLVFVPYKHALAGISEALLRENIDHATMSGDTPSMERSEIFTAFQQTSKYKVLVAHPQCLAHGVTLTEADTVIWFGPITSLEMYDQANARIRRVGQKHKQLVLHLQSTPIEKRVYAMLRQKQRVQDKLLELFEEATTHQEH